jgi:hypothetical protein
MPAPHVWAVLFFMMLITLGFGSMFGTLEGVITPLFDAKLFNVKKPYITGTLIELSYLATKSKNTISIPFSGFTHRYLIYTR